MKAYVFGWLCKINHMKIFSSQKRYCQEVILFKLVVIIRPVALPKGPKGLIN